jgi:dTDP-glucose 4,6-dehydratase
MRLCNVIGGDPSSDAKKNAFEFLVGKILRNEDINVYDGDNFRNYLHVEDVCRAINLVLEKGDMNTIYNIGSNQSVRIYDVMHYIVGKTRSKSRINLIPTPRFHQIVQAPDFFMDCGKLRELGFVQKYNIEQAVDLIISKHPMGGSEWKS